MFRTRFKKEILAEFLPPARPRKQQRVIIFCDGMPSVPRKQPLAEFLAGKGYWVFYPRYRGTWESDGIFLQKSPREDIRDVIDGLYEEIREIAFGKKFNVMPDEIFVIGGSFGGAAALLGSLDARVKRVVANCPVVDWSILAKSEWKETSNKSYVAYVREAFGSGYRITEKNWRKLYREDFYNPIYHASEIDATKVLMFHAKDDPFVPWRSVERFARKTGVKLRLFGRGGHLNTQATVRRHWPQIQKFFDAPITNSRQK
ncbi:MAG: alpha/beta hydrolase family protein [Acidobacteriaceae bacterium]